ncbi:PTS sugar transporter subunit IIA [Anaerobacillus alkalilacustris]|uniref:PTS sugar transporter subunit IIA n=1 Tax=Anaerobacillus alkalilacustris TaxID=393763 RepID=A0A1S2LJ73_9BACI|nr:PTS sugar transporter subunit IIA [Anaerobacillus alkalilacustris]OIJ12579.1 PTS sugar transporter subunit IIA [Anaerobacillus alkalilacustris]
MNDITFDETLILQDLQGDSVKEILENMGKNLREKGLVKDSFIEAVIERENKFATGLPTRSISVAIPHTDSEHVNQKSISLGILKDTVDFGIMGEESATTPVKLVFMLAMNEQHSQLSLLQKLMQLFQEEETLQRLVNESSKTTIKEIINQKLN